MQFRELKLRKDPDCPVCAEHPTQTELIDYEQFCGIAPAAGAAAEQRLRDVRARSSSAAAARAARLVVLDVRKPQEYEIARIAGATLIPLHELPDRLGELDPAATIVAHCHHGARSARAVQLPPPDGLLPGHQPGRRHRRLEPAWSTSVPTY